jgi:hypothetical protein
MPTLKGVLQKYHEGQQIFRRESVACLVARIEQLENPKAARIFSPEPQDPRRSCKICDGKGGWVGTDFEWVRCANCKGSGIY